MKTDFNTVRKKKAAGNHRVPLDVKLAVRFISFSLYCLSRLHWNVEVGVNYTTSPSVRNEK